MTAWLNGEWIDVTSAGIPIQDRGLLLGDGLFETLRHKDGRLHRGETHLARLQASCQSLGLVCPLDGLDWRGVIDGLIARQGLANAVIRISVTAGMGERGLVRSAEAVSSCLITATALAAPPQGIALATSNIRRAASSFASRHKTLSYIDNVMARRQARAAGADMALLLDNDGHLSGADCANLFWVKDGEIFTPALDNAVLPGTVRGALIAGLPVTEGHFGPEHLRAAEQVFLTNAVIGAVPVTRLDGAGLAQAPSALPEAVSRLAG